jgi:hypothetical protein
MTTGQAINRPYQIAISTAGRGAQLMQGIAHCCKSPQDPLTPDLRVLQRWREFRAEYSNEQIRRLNPLDLGRRAIAHLIHAFGFRGALPSRIHFEQVDEEIIYRTFLPCLPKMLAVQ